MSYKRCPQHWSVPEDRCWRVKGHPNAHRFAPIPDDVAEQAAARDLLLRAQDGQFARSTYVDRIETEQRVD